jgi:hypothetical protein
LLAAAVSAAIYFHGFNSTSATPDHNYIWQHPMTSIKFFLFVVGNVVGVTIPYHGPPSYANAHSPINYAVVSFGLAILILALVTLILGVRAQVGGEGRPIGMTLIVVGLLFATIVTGGRVALGYWVASGSRYTTFNLLTIVGIYLTLLPRSTSSDVATKEFSPSAGLTHSGAPPSRRVTVRRFDRIGPVVARWCLVPIIVIQLAVGLHDGLSGAANNHRYQEQAARVLRNIDKEPNEIVSGALYLFNPAGFVRREAQVLKDHRLSLFADGSGG